MPEVRESIAFLTHGAIADVQSNPHPTDRIERSNRYVQPALETMARFAPETFSALGVPGIAAEVTQLYPGFRQDKIAALEDIVLMLDGLRDTESCPAVRTDLASVARTLTWEADVLRIESALMLPCFDPARIVFEGLLSLLRTRADAGPAVRRRLRRYVGREEGHASLAGQAEAAIRSRLGHRQLLGPYRPAILENLDNGPRLLADISRLLNERGLVDHEEDFSLLQEQIAAYGAFIRREVLMRCRDDFRLPPELYAAQLRAYGVEGPATELASWGQVAFRELGRQLEVEARRLARARKWRYDGVRHVLEQLMARRISGDRILDHYRKRCRELAVLSQRKGILPAGQHLRLRRAGKAESAIYPFPHFRWPRFMGNRGEAGELILPKVDGTLASGYFTAQAVSLVVAAHEGVPGHALQVCRLLAPDIPLARSLLAFNHASLEGWAVYVESELVDLLPPETRLIVLHRNLKRAANAFLDPGLQQGIRNREQTRHFLETRVALSRRLADQQIWRYTRYPGQLTSYFWGYAKLAALRAEAEYQMGSSFDQREYHDCLLAQGLLPLSLLRNQVLQALSTNRAAAA